MKVTETLARYSLDLSYKALPKDVVHQAKRCFLDLIGWLSEGPVSHWPRSSGRPSRSWRKTSGHGPRTRAKTSVTNAALMNGARPTPWITTIPMCADGPSQRPPDPGRPGRGRVERASGKAALEAFIAGFEVETRIGRGMGLKHYDRGWHSTATFGRFGAAVAAGKLLGFPLTR